MADCLFCGIAAGEIPATQVLESERTIAFPDIKPQAPVHVLIIPRAAHSPMLASRRDETRRMRPADNMAGMRARVRARAGKGH